MKKDIEFPEQDQELRKLGLKVTLPRLRILEILERCDPHHVSAEDVYKTLLQSGEDVSLATVYRVLTQFEAAGLVRRHNFEGGFSVFELNQGHHHDHLVCLKCGRVVEFMDDVIENHQAAIAKKAGFNMTDHTLTIYGICEKCMTVAEK